MARAPSKLREYKRKRDFSRTAEPAGDSDSPASDALRFVIQKHAATRLHFDFRLELDGVMKSWAVPKGPSLDPAVKRLAMEVEDHPIEYNTFEGTIPKGQYGGGTVMLWDRGTYEAGGEDAEDGVAALRRGYRAGNLKVFLRGERLEGGFALVRMKGREPSDKPQWLLVKELDEWADRERDIVEEVVTSVESGRTMEEIARRTDSVWHSNRAESGSSASGSAGGRRKSVTKSGDSRTKRGGKSAAKKGARKRAAGQGSASRKPPATKKRNSGQSAAKTARKSPSRRKAARKTASSGRRVSTSRRPARRK